jgi:hypothetical protein
MNSMFSLIPRQITQSPDGKLWTALATASSVENPNKVWSRVKMALGYLKATEQSQRMFDALKMYLATQGRNPSLQFTPLGATALVTATTGDITNARSGVISIYGIYYKKSGTDGVGSATASFLKIIDDGTQDAVSGLAASVVDEITADVAGNEFVHLFPKGYALANGLRFVSVTAQNGLTIATAANSGNGFIVSGGAIVN